MNNMFMGCLAEAVLTMLPRNRAGKHVDIHSRDDNLQIVNVRQNQV